MTTAPALYIGKLRHRRFRPVPHAFEYPLFMVLLDIDHLRDAMAVSKFTSYNRWNWATFDERDHVGDRTRPLRDRLRDSAAEAGEELPDGPIHLLTHLRYLGYAFNPISLYYCHDREHTLRLVLADVSNTYGGRRSYWLRANGGDARRLRATREKALYVSPFMPYDVDYDFTLTPPAEQLVAHMDVRSRADENPGAGAMFDATLTLSRRPWTAANLRGALLRFPWMTAKVIAAIHWQALRLRLKRLPVMPFPPESRA